MGDPGNLARRESTDPGSCAALAKRWRPARKIFSESEEGDEIPPFEHGMAERRHPFERGGVAAREPLPPFSKKIFRAFPGGNAKQRHDEVARDELLIFNQQNPLLSFDDRGDEMHASRGRSPRRSRERLRRPARGRAAGGPERAGAAARRARRADERAKLHEGLVEVARTPHRHERSGERANPRERRGSLRVKPERLEAAENAHNVAVHDGLGDAERDRGDRGGRVRANAGQRAPALAAATALAARWRLRARA